MRRFPFGLLLILIANAAPASQGLIGQAYSYTKPVPGTQFLFVQRGDETAERAVNDSATRLKFEELRAKYARSGLYNQDNGELIWAVEDSQFAPYDNVYLSTDGIHLVRIEGEWWKTKDFTGGRDRLNAGDEAKQLKAPAVTFFARGKRIKQYVVKELIEDPAALPHTPEHLLWTTGANLDEKTGRFLLLTQDSARVSFDYRTGDHLGRTKLGLENPLTQTILAITGALTVVVLGLWVWFVFGRRTKATTTTAVGTA